MGEIDQRLHDQIHLLLLEHYNRLEADMARAMMLQRYDKLENLSVVIDEMPGTANMVGWAGSVL